MKGTRIVVAVSLALAAGLGPAGTPAEAGGMHGTVVGAPIIARGRPVASHPFVAQSIVQDPIVPHGFFSLPPVPPRRFDGHQRRSPRGFAPVAVFAPPVIVNVSPPGLYGGSGYYDDPGYYASPDDLPAAYNQAAAYGPPAGYGQPMIYAQPVDRSAAPPPPSAPNVVQYPTGRYELRGDGMSTPYNWVWIPNPPPPPPPPGPPPVGPPLFSGDPSAGRRSQLYRWTDDQGVIHLTDRLDGVPPEQRGPAKQAPPS